MQVSPRDRQVLTSWARSTSVRPELAQRARIVLLAADGTRTSDIATRTGVSKPTVIAWKKRYAAQGLGGLQDRRKPGRPRRTDDAAIVLATLEPPPRRLGTPHWSSRVLASELGVSNVKVAATWREFGLQPWRPEPLRFRTDPQLEVTAREVTGLYLNPPDCAVVLAAPGGQEPAGRTGLIQLTPGLPEDRPDGHARHEAGRHGAAALLAALRARAGQAADGASYPSRRYQWFLRFLLQAAAARPGATLYVVAAGSYATRRHPDVRAWLARHPLIAPHFTPDCRSWLTMTQTFVALGDRQAAGPATAPPARPATGGPAASTAGISAAICALISCWNDGDQPFSWTKPAAG